MAEVQGWSKTPHRCKLVKCEAGMWGSSYNIPGGKPLDFHMTLKREAKDGSGEYLDISLTPAEVRMMLKTIQDVAERGA